MITLFQAVFLPILLSPLAYLIGKKAGKAAGWFSFAVLLYSTIMLLLPSLSQPDYVEKYDWHPIGTFGLKSDGLSIPFAATIYLLSTALAVYSIPYMTHRIEEEVSSLAEKDKEKAFRSKIGLYYMLYMLYAAGMLGTVLATNLIQFYIFFELMLIPSFLLIAEFGYGDRGRISLLYFLWTHVGALVLLAGILTIGLTAGSFDMAAIRDASITGGIRTWVAVAVTIGLFVKLAAFGLHIWLPYAHAEAPTPISALLSPAMIGIGGYALIRLLVFILPSAYALTTLGIAVWGLITMVYGGLMALAQDDIKRLLAYSSVSQMGYIIFGIATATSIGISGAVFHYVTHGTGKAILFMAAGAIIMQAHGLRSVSKMGGLGRKLPITATAAIVGFLAIMGVPPMNGFQSEWMIFSGALATATRENTALYYALAVVALASTSLTAGYALLTVKRVFYGQLPAELKDVKEAPVTVTIPLLFLSFVTILLGIYPRLVDDQIIPLMIQVLGGG